MQKEFAQSVRPPIRVALDERRCGEMAFEVVLGGGVVTVADAVGVLKEADLAQRDAGSRAGERAVQARHALSSGSMHARTRARSFSASSSRHSISGSWMRTVRADTGSPRPVCPVTGQEAVAAL